MMQRRIVVLPEELQVIEERLEKIEKRLSPSNSTIEDLIMDTEGIMALLKVSRRCLQGWRDHGKIAFSQINGKFYYRLSAVNKMLEKHLVKVA